MAKPVARRLLAGGVAAVLATVGVQLVGTGNASAHTNTLSANAVCQQDASYTVTWTVSNQWPLAEDASVTAHSPGGSVNPSSLNLDSTASGTVTQSGIDGSARSASLSVHGLWTDGVTQNVSNSVTLDGKCATPPSVIPVAPAVQQATCYGGTPTAPALTLPSTKGIDYSASPSGPYAAGQTVLVTATATGGNAFAQPAPSAWTFIDSTHETYSVAFDKVTCGGKVTPAAPTVEQSKCSAGKPTAATLTLATTNGITYSAAPTGPYAGGQTVVVSATANGGNTFAAPAPSGWTFVDSTHETYSVTFNDTANCTTTVTPTPPTFEADQCVNGAPKGATYTIIATTGVDYFVSTVKTPAGVYPATPGTTVTITAKPQPGYALSGQTEFTHTYPGAPSCTTKVTPSTPSFRNDQCVSGAPVGATYTILATTGVVYKVNGMVTQPGTYPAADGSTINIAAGAQPGYELIGMTSFSHMYAATPDCNTKVTPTVPGFGNDQCVNHTPAGASYTIVATTGVDYFVGTVKTTAGKYPATDNSTVTITAKPQPGYEFSNGQHSTGFTHIFTATPTCTTTVETVAPGYDDSQCSNGTPTQATYTLTAVTGIQYAVTIGTTSTVVPAGTYPAEDSSTVTVKASPLPGYTIKGTTTFMHTYPATPTCLASVIAAPASFTDDVCVSDQLTGASYTIPPTTGVTYGIEGSAVGAGTYPATDGTTLTIVASAQPGFTLTGITQWTHAFPAKPANCNGVGNTNSRRPPSSTGTNGGTAPTSASRGGVGTASTGVPVEDILLTAIALLLLGMSCFVAAAARRRGQPTT